MSENRPSRNALRSVAAATSAAVCLACAPSALAQGGQVEVPIVAPPSSLSAELCLAGSCDTETSDVIGMVTIELNSFVAPTQIRIVSFDLNTTETLDFVISAGFLGRFEASTSTLALSDGGGVSPFGPVDPSGAFTIPSLGAAATGSLSYDASGIYCVGLQSAMLDCNADLDLTTLGGQTAPDVTGTVAILNNEVTLEFAVAVSAPLDDANPDLGGVSIDALARGSATLPDVCLADLSGPTTPGVPDGVLTGADFFEFLSRFQAGDLSIDFSSPTMPGVPDGVLTGADFFEFLNLFSAGC